MKRHDVKAPGWERRLVALGARLAGQPFAWGERDCTLVAAMAFDALTGGALAAAYRGQWRGAASALRFQRRFHASPARVLRQSGCVEVDPMFARRGDFICASDSALAGVHVVFGFNALSAWPGRFSEQRAPGRVGWVPVSVLMGWPGAVCLRVPD